MVVIVYNFVTMLKITELYTLEGWILYENIYLMLLIIDIMWLFIIWLFILLIEVLPFPLTLKNIVSAIKQGIILIILAKIVIKGCENALYTLFYLILITTLWHSCYYYHF